MIFGNFKAALAEWPRPTNKRTRIERIARRLWLFRRERHRVAYPVHSLWCQSSCYRDAKIKARYPVSYFLQETLPDALKNWKRRSSDGIWWLKYRLHPGHRYHTLKIEIEPGYHDTDQLMLHSLFTQVCEFVEIGLAHRIGSDEKKNHVFKNGRSRSAGLAYLDWEINDPDCQAGPAPTQADRAKVKKELYLWWRDARPARIEPWGDPAIWAEHRKKQSQEEDKDKGVWGIFNSGYDHTASEAASALEEFYALEDQQMMEKVISVWRSWWT